MGVENCHEGQVVSEAYLREVQGRSPSWCRANPL